MLALIFLILITGLTFLLILVYLILDYFKVVNSQPSHNKKRAITALRWFLGFNLINTFWNFSIFKTDPELMFLAWAGYFSLVWAASKFFGDGSSLKSVAYSIFTINININNLNNGIDNGFKKDGNEEFKKQTKLFKKIVVLKELCFEALTNLDEKYEPVKKFNTKIAEFNLALEKDSLIISDAIQTIMQKIVQQMDTRINGFIIAKSGADMYKHPGYYRDPNASLRLENYELIKEQYSDFLYGELTSLVEYLKKIVKQKEFEKQYESTSNLLYDDFVEYTEVVKSLPNSTSMSIHERQSLFHNHYDTASKLRVAIIKARIRLSANAYQMFQDSYDQIYIIGKSYISNSHYRDLITSHPNGANDNEKRKYLAERDRCIDFIENRMPQLLVSLNNM